MLTTSICKFIDFNSEWYKKQASALKIDDGSLDISRRPIHRKNWEFAAIAQALSERGMLRPGKAGIGFAVGTEPLPSFFASHGVKVTATDLDAEQSDPSWITTGQHAAKSDDLFKSHLVERQDFDRLVEFRGADMRALTGLAHNNFDFTWSSCALEHLGSLEAGWKFVEESMDLLKPGGVAVHTTEYNVSSNVETQEDGINVIYRRKDIEALDGQLRKKSCCLVSPDFDAGDSDYDLLYDTPPYYKAGRKHIKLELHGHVCTSAILIAIKASS